MELFRVGVVVQHVLLRAGLCCFGWIALDDNGKRFRFPIPVLVECDYFDWIGPNFFKIDGSASHIPTSGIKLFNASFCAASTRSAFHVFKLSIDFVSNRFDVAENIDFATLNDLDGRIEELDRGRFRVAHCELDGLIDGLPVRADLVGDCLVADFAQIDGVVGGHRGAFDVARDELERVGRLVRILEERGLCGELCTIEGRGSGF